MGGWTGSDDEESLRALDRAIALGCNFFDTAWVVRQRPAAKSCSARRCARHRGAGGRYVATKIPPKNMKWPAHGGVSRRRDLPARSHPRVHREEPARTSASTTIDLQQFHVWSDAWADDDGWQRAVDDSEAREAGARRSASASTAGSRPTCCARSRPASSTACRWSTTSSTRRRRTSCFPYCQAARHRGHRARAVRRRQPHRHADRRLALARRRLAKHLLQPRAARGDARARSSGLSPLVPEGMDLPELALRFILEHPAVSTTIPGMRRPRHVERNLAASDGARLPPRLPTRCSAPLGPDARRLGRRGTRGRQGQADRQFRDTGGRQKGGRDTGLRVWLL